jgi:alkylation response protein AidB-like acyl-CoA dehydrogenase
MDFAITEEHRALLTAQAAWLHDYASSAGEASGMAKYTAAEAALAAAIQTHGGNGVSTEYDLVPLRGWPGYCGSPPSAAK